MQLTKSPPGTDTALPLQQSLAYARALQRPAEWRTIADTHGPVAHALTLRGTLGAATTLRGPIWTRPLDTATRSAALNLLGLRLVEPDTPDDALRLAGFHALMTPTWIAEWDLTQPPEARLKNMHGKWRNALQQANRAPIHIKHTRFAPTPDHPLLIQCATQAKRRRYTNMPNTITCRIASDPTCHARLFEARLGRDTIAAMAFLQIGPVATYHLGWTGPQGRQYNAHHRLLTKAAEWFATRGAHRLDLGTLDTDAAPGLARFKIGTGASIRPLGGSHIRLWPVRKRPAKRPV